MKITLCDAYSKRALNREISCLTKFPTPRRELKVWRIRNVFVELRGIYIVMKTVPRF